MRVMHLSDLHIGKRVNEFSMIEDQKYILTKIINSIDENNIEAVIIAGDVYDKSVPSAEAVQLFDDFLVRLSKRNLKVFMISGNHDSAERIAFGGRIMQQGGIYVSPLYDGEIKPISINNDINVYMLPFLKPVNVKKYYPLEKIESYNDAIKVAVDKMNIDTNKINILVAHQFVTGATRSESEEISVGGSDNVDATIFKDFDYVALGHLHRSQKSSSEYIRYSGSPLKYSFSEAKDKKTVTIIDIKDKNDITLEFVELIPKRDLVEIRGTYEELTLKSFYENTSYREDYMHITLTDEEDIVDVFSKLRVIYKNIMKMDYDNKRTRTNNHVENINNKEKTPYEYFSDLYIQQNGQSFNEEQSKYVLEMIEDIWEGK